MAIEAGETPHNSNAPPKDNPIPEAPTPPIQVSEETKKAINIVAEKVRQFDTAWLKSLPKGSVSRNYGEFTVSPQIHILLGDAQITIPVYAAENEDADQLFLTAAKAALQRKWPHQKETDREQTAKDLLPLAVKIADASRKPLDPPSPSLPQKTMSDGKALLQDPDIIKQLQQDLETIGIAGEERVATLIYLVGTSRLLDQPLALIVQGPSSGGKSFLTKGVSELFPPDHVNYAHSLSRQALVYEENKLSHVFLVGGERSKRNDPDATRALRELLSDGRLTRKIAGVQLVANGPVAYVESTTTDPEEIFGEDLNRCVLAEIDSSPSQTQKILLSIGKRKSTARIEDEAKTTRQKHQAAQLQLKRVKVIIPYAEELARLFDHESIESRRRYPQLLSLIEAIALLKQYQRLHTPKDDAVIPALIEDYELARSLLANPKPTLKDLEAEIYDCLKQKSAPLDPAAIAEAINKHATGVRRKLESLEKKGLIKRVQQAAGKKPAKYEVIDPDAQDDLDLPGASQLGTSQNPHKPGHEVAAYFPPLGDSGALWEALLVSGQRIQVRDVWQLPRKPIKMAVGVAVTARRK